MDTYVIGCDYGTLSMRSLLVRVRDGFVAAEATFPYPHGVITGELPEGKAPLPGSDWALQDPDDYLDALTHCIPSVLRQSGVSREHVIALGLDFTTCTMMPMSADGRALCQIAEFRNRPHAWVKLWKNHTAYREADELTRYVQDNGYHVLDYYGMRASSEWMLPKIWEILRKDPEVYQKAYTFIEAGDFVVYQLCGKIVRSGVFAAARGLYNNKTRRYPDASFFRGLDPRLENIVEEKHLGNVVTVGTPAGTITAQMAKRLGLSENTIICTAHADAACTLPGAGVAKPNEMVYVMGTSICQMMLAENLERIPGITAAFYEGVIPGYYCYEAGQSAGGDIFNWYCSMLPAKYSEEAGARGVHIMDLMNEKAGRLAIGQSGVMALDWLNGNRSILQDSNLTGLLAGLTLSTTPEEIYRALLESVAFGTRVIMDQFNAYHVPVRALHACGGLAQKNGLLMQIYSDVMDMPIRVCAVKQTSALASAIFASAAAGEARGGYQDVKTAAAAMVPPPQVVYRPSPGNVPRYRELYGIYRGFHDQMSQGADSPMRRLRGVQRAVLSDVTCKQQ